MEKFSFCENGAWLSPRPLYKAPPDFDAEGYRTEAVFPAWISKKSRKAGILSSIYSRWRSVKFPPQNNEHFYCVVLSNSLLQNLVQQYVECVFLQFLRKVILKRTLCSVEVPVSGYGDFRTFSHFTNKYTGGDATMSVKILLSWKMPLTTNVTSRGGNFTSRGRNKYAQWSVLFKRLVPNGNAPGAHFSWC